MKNPFEEIINHLNQRLSETDQKIDRLESLLIALSENTKIQVSEQEKSELQYVNDLPDTIKSSHVRKLFGNISFVTLWQWEKKGLLNPAIVNERKYYKKSEVLDLLKNKSTKKISQTIKDNIV